jgi:putative copper export protein
LNLPPAPELAISVLRWLEYVGLLGFIGVVVVRRLAGMRPPLKWARVSMQPALTAAFVGGLLVAAADWLQAGHPNPAILVRAAAEGGALGLCIYAGRWVAAPAIIAVLALPFAGHAAAFQPPGGVIFTDAVHVLSAGIWGGGILVLATLHPPDGWGGGEGRAMLQRFGRVAFLAFSITALTGVLRAAAVLPDLSSLWTSPYGTVLLVKTAGVLAMVAISALGWRRGWRYARADGLLVLLVLAASALLAAYPMPLYPSTVELVSH